MKTSTLRKAIPAALLLAGVCGLSSTANASVYGIAYDNIFDLDISSNPLVLPGEFTQFSTVSAAAANLNGLTAGGGSDSQGGPVDSPLATGLGSVFVGAAPTNNGMTAEGQGGNFSYSDSQISSTEIQDDGLGNITATGDLTQAWGIAEAFVPNTGNADASTRNSSVTGFDTSFVLQDATAFTFEFKAAPYMFTEMTNSSSGVSANAEISVIVTITNAAGATVFRWSPDGAIGGNGDIGVNDETDDYSLNNSVEVSVPGTSAFYDPTGAGAPNGTINPGAFGNYAATTDLLAVGAYSISLGMVENTDMRNRAVPVPGVLALMGLGLAGLGFSRRRK